MISKLSALAVVFSILTSPVAAQAIGEPTGEVILTVSGNIDANGRDEVDFDLGMLEAMGVATVRTTTPWFEGESEFVGVPMADLMEAVGARGSTLVAIALNDYASDLPIEDFARHGVVLAYERDGAPMPISEKGPLFVIYPFDSKPELQNQMYYARAVWQVKEFIVK